MLRSWMIADGGNEHLYGMLEVARWDDPWIKLCRGRTLESGRLQPRTKPSGCGTVAQIPVVWLKLVI